MRLHQLHVDQTACLQMTLQPKFTWRFETGGPQTLPASLKPGMNSRKPRLFAEATILFVDLIGGNTYPVTIKSHSFPFRNVQHVQKCQVWSEG